MHPVGLCEASETSVTDIVHLDRMDPIGLCEASETSVTSVTWSYLRAGVV